MALRTSTRLLNARLTTTAVRQQPMRMAMRAQSTLNTGEVLEDPQIGDYPNLPRYSTQTRGPYGWWDPQDKRNFGETVHEEDELYGVWAPDLFHYSPYKALAQLGLAAGIFAGVSYLVYNNYPERPASKRTYPYDGLKAELGSREYDIRPRGARPDTEA
ncbi:nadh-ubiquinone oxidoreductase ashi subunit (ci-ashi or ndufb8) domain-containing protein [Lichtheimia corymbifera JMRC:FSU:9682]|uniref:Nadh-ubiquinone oxidoreductase ashi subunit (Ci-ashi or ndufb8) domain-containing protein n=2 Tax=Lichtheimia TaxID=688353 RepID=A0A068S340_9FUNG|nr:uncharacterized protein O0I10_011104 [Lichtheimia ornata]KAJ8653256.1 hypothetical protein O0I10_011104 [Lichtheimia ornata]CDH56272.1 nadh-ubiquinone oxidoreductase ashi subunit (ci-ashi or ndufb8) domain-containing protein [Lichtheimia corymbifera JMRC:FSU:9682]